MTGENTHHHHHLICLNCGKVYAFEEDMLDSLEDHIMERMGFRVTNHKVKLLGYCRDCLSNHLEKETENGTRYI